MPESVSQEALADAGRSWGSYVILERKFDKTAFLEQTHPVFRYIDRVLKSDEMDLTAVVPEIQRHIGSGASLLAYEQIMIAKLQVEILARSVLP